MKNITLVLVAVFTVGFAFAQPQPTKLTKLCIDGDVSSLMNIRYLNGKLFAQATNRLVVLDPITGNQLQAVRAEMGFGLFQYGNKIMYSNSRVNYNEKDEPVSREGWVYWVNTENIAQRDSIKFPYSIVTMASSATESSTLALINQKGGINFRAVIVDKVTGAEKFVLFTEVFGTGAVLPHSIEVDPGDKYVALGTANGNKGFYLYDKATGKQLLNLPGVGDIHNIVFSSDSKYCFYVQKGTLKVVNVTSLKLEKEIAIAEELTWVAIHPQNEIIAITGFGYSGALTTVNWKTGNQYVSKIFTRGGASHYSSEGNLFIPFRRNAVFS
ncbi:MAG: hypothetical protein IPH24_11450 [Crocinitomicaceae bacterium]|nr:hypothetical protein [Crocinitomicaceae bacterium]